MTASIPVASAAPQPLAFDVEGGESTSFVVPEGVTSLTFTVAGGAGGAGGSGWSSMLSEGGAGAEVSGTIAVRPGNVVTLQSAEAGQEGTGRITGVNGSGGAGYSPGGSGGQPLTSQASGSGGGGGGSSALVIDGVPVAVAGSGGGGGGTGYESRMWQAPVLQRGGNGGSQSGGVSADGSGGGAGGAFGGASSANGTDGSGASVGATNGGGGGGGGGHVGGVGGAHGFGRWSNGFEEHNWAAGGGGGGAGTSMIAPEVTAVNRTLSTAHEGAVSVTLNARAALDVTVPETIHRHEPFTVDVKVDFIEQPRSYAGHFEVVWEGGATQTFETSDARATTSVTLTPSGATAAPLSIVYVPTDASDSRASYAADMPVTLYPVQVNLSIADIESGWLFLQRDHDLTATLIADSPAPLVGTMQYRVDGNVVGSLPVEGPGEYSLAWRPTQKSHTYSLTASFVPHADSAYAAASGSLLASFQAAFPTVNVSVSTMIRMGQRPMQSAYVAHADGTTPGGRFTTTFTNTSTKRGYEVSVPVSGNNVAFETPQLPVGEYSVYAYYASGYELSQPGWAYANMRVEKVPTSVSIAPTETWYPVPTAEIRAVVTNDDSDDGRSPAGSISFDVTASGTTTTVQGSPLPGGDPGTTVYLARFPSPATDEIIVTADFVGDAIFASSESGETTLHGGVWPMSAFGALSQQSSTSNSRGVTYTVMVEQIISDAPPFSGTARLLIDGVLTGHTLPITNGKATLNLPSALSVGSYRVAAQVDLSASGYGITTLDASIFTVNPIGTTTSLSLPATFTEGVQTTVGASVTTRDGSEPDGSVVFEAAGWRDTVLVVDGRATTTLVPVVGMTSITATFVPSSEGWGGSTAWTAVDVIPDDTGANSNADADSEANVDAGADGGTEAGADGASNEADADVDAGAAAGAGADVNAIAEADVMAGADANAATEANAGADADADAGADVEANASADSGVNAGTDAGADVDANAGADADANAGADADANVNAGAGADSDATSGADVNADAGVIADADVSAAADADAHASAGADGETNDAQSDADSTADGSESGSDGADAGIDASSESSADGEHASNSAGAGTDAAAGSDAASDGASNDADADVDASSSVEADSSVGVKANANVDANANVEADSSAGVEANSDSTANADVNASAGADGAASDAHTDADSSAGGSVPGTPDADVDTAADSSSEDTAASSDGSQSLSGASADSAASPGPTDTEASGSDAAQLATTGQSLSSGWWAAALFLLLAGSLVLTRSRRQHQS